VRGWSRTRVAPAASASGSVVGWLQPPDGPGSTPATGDVLPQLDIPDLIPRLSQNLYGAYVISEHPDAGLTQVTASQLPSADPTTGLRNFLYAIEWWLFACFVVYAWWKHVQERTSEPGSGQVQDLQVPSAP
jgi:surfeit locus 1 family protein